MSSHTTQLAQAGYACKLACQKLEIPCTVVLWDTEALTLWDANEPPRSMPTIVANGGTVPDMALGDLDNQRCDRSKHLVLIMTDGQWQGRWSGGGGGTLAWYKDDGRTIIGFGFGSGQNRGLDQRADGLRLRRGVPDQRPDGDPGVPGVRTLGSGLSNILTP